MNTQTFRNYCGATMSALLAGAFAVTFWIYLGPTVWRELQLWPTEPATQTTLVVILTFCIANAIGIQRLGVRRLISALIGMYLLVALIGVIGLRFNQDCLALPLVFGGLLSLVLAQLWKLRTFDAELASGLFSVAAQTDQSAASPRILSGLKLLDSVFLLNEAIVFQWDSAGALETVARLKGSRNTALEGERNSLWREGVRLCERAVKNDALLSAAAEDNMETVAVPLRLENDIVGALLLKLASSFDKSYSALLEAIGSQFARNLRREKFMKGVLSRGHVRYLSTSYAQKKLEALQVVKAQVAEHGCDTHVLQRLTEGLAICHLDGTISDANSAFLSFAGLTRDEASGVNMFSVLDNFRTGVFDEPAIAVRRVLQTGITYEGELIFPEKNQTLGISISLIKEDDSQQPIALAIYVRDLTGAKEYDKLKSDIISLMSHELRTPLTSINGFAELLTADETIPEQAREFVTIIANESQRLSRMINTFLAVTQLQRKDKQEVLKIPLRLDEVVRETVATLLPVAKKKRIRLVEQPAARVPPVAADKSLITQALKNLLNNAIKYSPERTTVTVSTALEAEAVRVSVEDRGFGIPAEAKDKIWDKFYRVVRDGQEKDEESTGLGLSFVREVVEQHGGQVELDTKEGRGSRFSFTLPRL
ncbi:MAG: ATP-binding protein [Pyrinomonadaceae bacterium]